MRYRDVGVHVVLYVLRLTTFRGSIRVPTNRTDC